jgi:hypothetical protein
MRRWCVSRGLKKKEPRQSDCQGSINNEQIRSWISSKEIKESAALSYFGNLLFLRRLVSTHIRHGLCEDILYR